ncbi:MAG TPA: hypothetical protein DDW52_12625 [Planctomycetaceae bacterium]|nr:hypothetical protein [Planctomycetaceae bacterium]
MFQSVFEPAGEAKLRTGERKTLDRRRPRLEEMRQLVVMRHAEANFVAGQPDLFRALTITGQRAAAAAARQLDQSATTADRVLASTAVRVQQTLACIREHWQKESEVENDPDLYLATLDELGEKLKAQPESFRRIMIIGHNPGLSEFVTFLTGSQVHLQPAEMVHMQAEVAHWDDSFTNGLWDLKSTWTPPAAGTINVCR